MQLARAGLRPIVNRIRPFQRTYNARRLLPTPVASSHHQYEPLPALFAMDLFEFNSTYYILICRQCQYAVRPNQIKGYLRASHPQHDFNTTGDYNKSQCISDIAATFTYKYNILDPDKTSTAIPPRNSPPILNLRLHRGIQCSKCPHISTGKTREEVLSKHFNQEHRLVKRGRGGNHKVPGGEGPMWHEVCYQRFFVSGKVSGYFQVAQPLRDDVLHHPPVQKWQLRGQALLRALVDKQLDQRAHDLNAASRPYQDRATATEVSP